MRALEADNAALEEQLESVMRMRVEDMPSMNFGLVYSDHKVCCALLNLFRLDHLN